MTNRELTETVSEDSIEEVKTYKAPTETETEDIYSDWSHPTLSGQIPMKRIKTEPSTLSRLEAKRKFYEIQTLIEGSDEEQKQEEQDQKDYEQEDNRGTNSLTSYERTENLWELGNGENITTKSPPTSRGTLSRTNSGQKSHDKLNPQNSTLGNIFF